MCPDLLFFRLALTQKCFKQKGQKNCKNNIERLFLHKHYNKSAFLLFRRKPYLLQPSLLFPISPDSGIIIFLLRSLGAGP